jgi:hypothetical protein
MVIIHINNFINAINTYIEEIYNYKKLELTFLLFRWYGFLLASKSHEEFRRSRDYIR